MDATLKKSNGVHYTPPALAAFLAAKTALHVPPANSFLSVLDPACGDGALLHALSTALPCSSVELNGFDTDPDAVQKSRTFLSQSDRANFVVRKKDFLEYALKQAKPTFDCVIANPPYVRTQVLGGARSKQLAAEFGLTGRVDLYQAFVAGITKVLKPGGVMGLLASNRFMTVKAGHAMRKLILDNFELREVFDLGDTKLFQAAVLPMILIANKKPLPDSVAERPQPKLHRVYRIDQVSSKAILADPLKYLGEAQCGRDSDSVEVVHNNAAFKIQKGEIVAREDGSVWTLTNATSKRFLNQIAKFSITRFGDVADIKVGIKTTADKVFIRESWEDLRTTERPESNLLHPLLTHHDAERWSAGGTTLKTVLYPYDMRLPKRTVVEQGDFPRAFKYLQSHRAQLAGRDYVTESGRDWFEIWVPHQPVDWSKPKIVWPDISTEPRFFLDNSGAIVNGDCYWIKLKPDSNPDWMYLMLAVANSTIATEFYDTQFHNKLYAGRRRFMSQYVRQFPLPDLKSEIGNKIVTLVKRELQRKTRSKGFDALMDQHVRRAFGFKS